MTQPLEVTLTIDLDKHLARHVGYDEDGEPVQEATTVEDVVLGLAASKIAASAINTAVKDEYNGLRTMVRQVAESEIRERLRPLIDEALTRSIQPTNPYGEATKEPMTFSEVIIQTARDMLTKTTSTGYNKPQRTLVQNWLHDEAEAVIKKELAAALKEAKVEVVSAVRAKGAEILQETITRSAGVR